MEPPRYCDLAITNQPISIQVDQPIKSEAPPPSYEVATSPPAHACDTQFAFYANEIVTANENEPSTENGNDLSIENMSSNATAMPNGYHENEHTHVTESTHSEDAFEPNEFAQPHQMSPTDPPSEFETEHELYPSPSASERTHDNSIEVPDTIRYRETHKDTTTSNVSYSEMSTDDPLSQDNVDETVELGDDDNIRFYINNELVTGDSLPVEVSSYNSDIKTTNTNTQRDNTQYVPNTISSNLDTDDIPANCGTLSNGFDNNTTSTSETPVRTFSDRSSRKLQRDLRDTRSQSDTQLDLSAALDTSPRLYRKNIQRSPDNRHIRKKVRPRSADTSFPSKDHNEISTEHSTAMNGTVTFNTKSEDGGVEIKTINGKSQKLSEKKSKFSVTKVPKNELHRESRPTSKDCTDNTDGSKLKAKNAGKNGKLKIDILRKFKDPEKEDLTVDLNNITPGDADVFSDKKCSLELDGHFLDADMLYEWTLEKKTELANQIKNVQMTKESRPPPPQDYIVFSILVLVCCNLPFGLIALWLSRE